MKRIILHDADLLEHSSVSGAKMEHWFTLIDKGGQKPQGFMLQG